MKSGDGRVRIRSALVAHGIDPGALYRSVPGDKRQEVCGDRQVPDTGPLRDWTRTIPKHSPPEPAVPKERNIMSRQIDRSRAKHGPEPNAPTWTSHDERRRSVSDENFHVIGNRIKHSDERVSFGPTDRSWFRGVG